MAEKAGPQGPEGEERREPREEERENQPKGKGEDERESIWSIPARYKGWYFSLFSFQFIIAAVWLIWDSVTGDALPSTPKKVLFVWQGMAPMAITSAASSLVIVEAWRMTMVIASWLEETLEKRRQRQIKAAEERGFARGRAELQKDWQDWNRRREAAAAVGEDFNEPPPGVDQETEDTQQK